MAEKYTRESGSRASGTNGTTMHKTSDGKYYWARPSTKSSGVASKNKDTKGKEGTRSSQGSSRPDSGVYLASQSSVQPHERRHEKYPDQAHREPSIRAATRSDGRSPPKQGHPANARTSERSQEFTTPTYVVRTRPESAEERNRRRREERTAQVLSDLAKRTAGQSKVWMQHGQNHLDLARSLERTHKTECRQCDTIRSELYWLDQRGRKPLVHHEKMLAKAALQKKLAQCEASHEDSEAGIDAKNRATWCLTMCRMTPQPLTSRWLTDSVQVPDAAQIKAFERLTRETDPAKRTEHSTVWNGTSTRTAEDLALVLHSQWPTIRKALDRYDSYIPPDVGYQEPSAKVFGRCFDIIANQPELFAIESSP